MGATRDWQVLDFKQTRQKKVCFLKKKRWSNAIFARLKFIHESHTHANQKGEKVKKRHPRLANKY